MEKLNTTFSSIIFVFFINILISCASCSKEDNSAIDKKTEKVIEPLELTKTIPVGSNSWVKNNLTKDEAMISAAGIHDWSSLGDVINTYVKTGAGKLNIGLKIKSATGAKIKITIGNSSKEINVSNTKYKIVDIGTFTVSSGYINIEIKGLEKSGTQIADITDILFGGSAISSGITFVPSKEFYFGRRGPSVHMTYNLPEGKDVKWFYNEVTVPKGEDKLGTFFMANGHAQGYFGMQVNSDTERRVLFSIWSAFSTDDPNQIPKDYKVTNLGNGAGVTVQDFGNEGSGMQSFIDVGWKAGITYKFLLKGEPSTVVGSTDYTGYFFDPQVGEWKLIASLRRPKTATHLKRTHSFLENFSPSAGHLSRKVNYGNQWAYTTDNNWIEMTSGKFTVDATATNGYRLDFEGGVDGNKFFLKNCGFFNADVQPNSVFTRTSSGAAPTIDFSSLEVPKPPISATPVALLDRKNWTIIDISSEEAEEEDGVNNGLASDVLDNNKETYWHSCWGGTCSSSAYPHHLTIDMGANTDIEGLQINQRSTTSRAVSNITVNISSDNTNWTSIGDFDLAKSADSQNIDFGSIKTIRYIKVTMNSSHDGDRFASLGEIKGYKIWL